MSLAEFLRVIHALAGVAFVAGLLGLSIVVGMARRAATLSVMIAMLDTATRFGILVSGGGITLTVSGVSAAVALGRPLFGPLQGARADWLFASVILMLPIMGFLVSIYPRFGRRLRAELQAARDVGEITPGLRNAWADSRYTFARRYEMGAVLIVLVLMIARPA